MREIAGYIPDIGEEEFEKKILKFQDLEVELPLLTNEQMNKVIDTVKRGSAERLKSLTVSEVVEIIDKVTEKFLRSKFILSPKGGKAVTDGDGV